MSLKKPKSKKKKKQNKRKIAGSALILKKKKKPQKKQQRVRSNSNAPPIKKKTKTKYKAFKKCPGYESIKLAESLEQEKKFNAAIKHYATGCDELEEYTKNNIDNALEKRKRMEQIQGYRQKMQKLQNQKNTKRKKQQKTSAKKQHTPFKKEEGYAIVQQAIDFKKNEKFEKAIQHYEKGLVMLEQGLSEITDSKENKSRRQQINEWRADQQSIKNKLNSTKPKAKKQRKNSSKKEQHKPIAFGQEEGYKLVQKAENFEKEQKFEVAIKFYEKGLPMLEETMLSETSSKRKRERMQHIESYRHKLQKLKNKQTRRKSQFISSIPMHQLASKRKSQIIDQNLFIKAAFERDISGGALYKSIRDGTLSLEVIKSCNRMSLYMMIPILASSCIHSPLPFRSFLCEPLVEAMNAKIEISGSLMQRLRFFLFSYYSLDIIQSIWGDHPAMPLMLDADDLNIQNDEENETKEIGGGDDMQFEDLYMEKDAILFFQKVANMNEIEIGFEIVIDSEYENIYDLMGKDVLIHKVRIEKIFKSNAKPLLVSAWHKQSDRKYKEVSKFILKKGDDLRLDAGVMHMFRFFNSIWSEEGLFYDGYAIQCLLYNVVPMGDEFGIIEFIPQCKPLRDVSDYFGKLKEKNIKNLVATAAGSYVASFVLGVRDRHFDNVLIQSDGTLFHIDFGYVMGSKLLMDTSKIAITNDLSKLFEDHWDNFVETAVNSFMTLRLHYQEILDYSHLVFDFLDLEVDSSEFLYKMLMMHETDRRAEERIRNKFQNAPSSWNTKIKNATHYLATL